MKKPHDYWIVQSGKFSDHTDAKNFGRNIIYQTSCGVPHTKKPMPNSRICTRDWIIFVLESGNLLDVSICSPHSFDFETNISNFIALDGLCSFRQQVKKAAIESISR
jgi:hypothetical protein